jgi:hypothetical protein
MKNLSLYCKSMGKVFKVRHIATTDDDANAYMEKNKDCGVIAVGPNGLVYIADFHQITVPSGGLPG